jgi:PAS domain S-box-containing protein
MASLGDSEFRHLADNLPVLCWIARGDGYIVWYNRRWHDYCGSTPEQMQGWGWQSVHDPEELPSVTQRWVESIASGEPFEMIFPLKGADGRFRPFLTRISPLRDASGDVVRWFGTNVEIGAQVRAELALSSSEARYTVLTEAMPQMVWSTLPNGFHDYYNDQWYRFTGVPYGSTDGEAWKGMFHPDDQERAWATWRRSLETGELYEIEYRLRHYSGEYRWTLGRALPVRDGSGNIVRWIGTCTDIHDAKMAAEQNEILSRELSHRIKNIFAVISGLVGLSARNEPQAKGFAARLTERIMALGRAHEFARPHSDQSRPAFEQTTLATMLADLMQPYQLVERIRVAIGGDDVEVDDQAATPVALIFHELATNAAKYGALSVPDGRVTLTISQDGEDVLIRWQEAGGPAVSGPPTRTGFGSRLAELSVRQQLGGEIDRYWNSEGLMVDIRLRSDRLLRRRLAHA